MLPEVQTRLEAAGWIYRGDARDEGGHVFVLESHPYRRIAHLHVVARGGTQWRNYLRFRDLLRADASARAQYEATKLLLAAAHPADREAYTLGKTRSTAIHDRAPEAPFWAAAGAVDSRRPSGVRLERYGACPTDACC